MRCPVKVFDPIPLRRRREPAVERVRPAVVAAAEHLSLTAAFGDGAGAVAADVRERPQSIVRAAHDDDRLVADVGGEVLTGFGDLLGATDELPRAREDR